LKLLQFDKDEMSSKIQQSEISKLVRVGIFGKTLTKEQQSKLQQLPLTHIIILTDNDQAGRESKIQLQRQLGRFYKLSFPKLNHKDIGEMSIEQIKKNVLSQIRG